MEEIREILYLLKLTLQNNVAPNGFLDNVVEYLLPIFSMLVVIIGGVWTMYTYIKGKNKEANEKILEEVYLPLFQFFATNDSLAQIGNIINIDYVDNPFLEWKNTKTNTKMEIGKTTKTEETSPVLGLTRQSLIDSINKINLGLSPKGLVALISAYKASDYAVNHFKDDKEINQRAEEYRTKLEYALRVEAYKGYKKYHKKLGLLNGANSDNLFKIFDDHLQLSLKPLPKECEKKFEDN